MVDLPKDIQREYGSDDYPEKVIRAINNTFDNAIIATDVRQNQLWATQFLELSEKSIALLEKCYVNRIEIVREGSVAIETLSITER